MSIGDWAALVAAIAAVIVAIPAIASNAPHRKAFIAGAAGLVVLAVVLGVASALIDDGSMTRSADPGTTSKATAGSIPPSSGTPSADGSPTPSSPAGGAVYSQVRVGLPGGNCGAQTHIDFDPPAGGGPEVSPATNPINGAGTADLALSDCGSPQGQALTADNNGRLAVLESTTPTAQACVDQLQRAPVAEGVLPRVGLTVCVSTDTGAIAAVTITGLPGGNEYRVEGAASLWRV